MGSLPTPNPVTATEIYLAQLVDEIRLLREEISASAAGADAGNLPKLEVPTSVDLVEPAARSKPTRKRTARKKANT